MLISPVVIESKQPISHRHENSSTLQTGGLRAFFARFAACRTSSQVPNLKGLADETRALGYSPGMLDLRIITRSQSSDVSVRVRVDPAGIRLSRDHRIHLRSKSAFEQGSESTWAIKEFALWGASNASLIHLLTRLCVALVYRDRRGAKDDSSHD